MNANDLRLEIQGFIKEENVFITPHAHQALLDDDFFLDDVLRGLSKYLHPIEYYHNDKRGPSCLVLAKTDTGRFIHVVCTMGGSALVIITVYDPKPPVWRNAMERETKKK